MSRATSIKNIQIFPSGEFIENDTEFIQTMLKTKVTKDEPTETKHKIKDSGGEKVSQKTKTNRK